MWSMAVVFAFLTALALAQAGSKELYQYKMKNLDNIKSPKRQSSALLLGGRFGRSCLLMAGGCLGKRSKPWEAVQYRSNDIDSSPDFVRDFSALNEMDFPARNQIPQDMNKNENQRSLYPYSQPEEKILRTSDPDYPNLFLQ